MCIRDRPRKKAISATRENKEKFEQKRIEFEARNLETKSEAEGVGKKLNGNHVVMIRQAGEGGQLYGSVNARDVANGLVASGYKIDRRQVSLERPIKSVGLYPIKIALHPEVTATVTANEARSEDEAIVQEKTGEAVITVETDNAPPVAEALVETNTEEQLQEPNSPDKENQGAANGNVGDATKAKDQPEK